MKFKLDENLGARMQAVLRNRGHDADTVKEEGLSGSSDRVLYDACCAEARCLLTLDLDFSDVLRFPPHRCGGIAVLRVPKNPSLELLRRMIERLLDTMDRESLAGRLWIIEVDRIRIHQDTNPDD